LRRYHCAFLFANQSPRHPPGAFRVLADTMPIGIAAFEDRRFNHSRDLYALLARRHLRQVPHLLPPDAPPEHASNGRRARIDAHRYEWAIADSRDDG